MKGHPGGNPNCVLSAPRSVWKTLDRLMSDGFCVRIDQLDDWPAAHPDATWVGYDMETGWESCDPDRKTPIRSIRRFGRQAADAGLKIVMACHVRPEDGVSWEDFISAQAEASDILVVQTMTYPQCVPAYRMEIQQASDIVADVKPQPIIANMIRTFGCVEDAQRAAKHAGAVGWWLWDSIA